MKYLSQPLSLYLWNLRLLEFLKRTTIHQKLAITATKVQFPLLHSVSQKYNRTSLYLCYILNLVYSNILIYHIVVFPIIHFYSFNDVFLGHCPGSPKVSTFPSLPDMSPKKVSAAHNVYVSPLRSSKVMLLMVHLVLRFI